MQHSTPNDLSTFDLQQETQEYVFHLWIQECAWHSNYAVLTYTIHHIKLVLRKIFLNICNHSISAAFFSPKNDFTQYAGYLNGHQIATSAHEKLATSSKSTGSHKL